MSQIILVFACLVQSRTIVSPQIMLEIHVNQGLSCLQFPVEECLVYQGQRCVSEVSLEF
jgi:hypothetical protein